VSISLDLTVDLLLEDVLTVEGQVHVASTLEELVLELDPVETQSMQKALKHIHQHKHTEGYSHEGEPDDEGTDGLGGDRVLWEGVPWHLQDLLQEHKGELGVSEGESPQTQVGGSVGDGTKHELDGLNQLVDSQLSQVDVVATFGLLVQQIVVQLHLFLEFIINTLGLNHFHLIWWCINTASSHVWLNILWGMAVISISSVLWHTSSNWTALGRAWLNEQHDWHTDDYENDKGLRDGTLSWEQVHVESLS